MNLFVTAIDTDAGKTLVTGLLARFRAQQGRSVITQKLVQTGGDGASEDVRLHRRIMGEAWTAVDRGGDTCPYLFRLPASPHLAAEQEGATTIDPVLLTAATERLAAAYDDVIIEGVGGVCVPLNRECLLVDYIASRGYPTVLVASARLGSINHTLMSLEVLKAHGVQVVGIIYNRFFDGCVEIADDSRSMFEGALGQHGYPGKVVDLPAVRDDAYPDIDFGILFE